MAQIFRKSALDKLSSPEQLDKMIVIINPSFWIAALGGALIILVALIWSIFGRLPEKVEANGIFMDEGGIRTVVAENSGIVSEVLVSEGEQVSIGQEIARLGSEEARKQLDILLERRDGVDIVTFYSEDDAATADNKTLLDIKSQRITGGSNLATNKALLETKEKELAEQEKKTAEAKNAFEKAKKDYYATMGMTDTTSKQMAYQDASADLQATKQYQGSVESALAEAQSKVDALLEQRKPYADELASAQAALSEAQANSMSAESHMKDMESDMLAAKSNWESATFAFQNAGPNEDRPALAAAADAAKSSYDNAYDFYTDAQKAYDSAASKVKDAQDKVDACKQQLDVIDSQLADAQEELASAQSMAESWNDSLSSAQTNYVESEKEYVAAMQEQAKQQSDNSRAGTEYQAALNTYSTAVNQLSSLQDSVNQLQAQVAAEESNLDRQNSALILQFNSAKGAVLEQLDQEIDKYEQMIEDSTIRSTMNGFISGLNIAKGNTVQQGSVVCRIAADANAERIVICYVPVAEGRKLAAGMRVEVYPSTVNRQEYGHMEGTVLDVAQFVTSQEEIRNQLGDASLVQNFTQSGAVVAVKVALRTDPDTVSGYWWSSKKGAEVSIEDGTIISSDIVTQEKAPITMLIPFLKDKLTIKPVENSSSN